MRPKLQKIIHALILAPILPLVGLLAGWWGGYSLLPEKWIPLAALAGLALGIALDVLWLRRLVAAAPRFHVLTWVAVFLFYSMSIFGMFMGVPVMNALLAVPAGFVAAARMGDPSAARRASRRAAAFTTAVLLLVCAASATIALLSSSTASDLQGMLGLPFRVTQGMVLALILLGGALLLAVNWALTLVSSLLSFKLLRRLP